MLRHRRRLLRELHPPPRHGTRPSAVVLGVWTNFGTRWALLLALIVGCQRRQVNPVQPELKWTRVPLRTTDHQCMVLCAEAGRVTLVDCHGGVHVATAGGEVPSDSDAPSPVPFITVRAGQRVYRVSERGALMRSVDGGKRWKEGPRIEPPGDGLRGHYFTGQRLAITPDGKQLYARGQALMVHTSLESNIQFLLRSEDDGETWKLVYSGSNHGPMGIGCREMPDDMGRGLAIAPDGAVWATAFRDGSVLRSSDGGVTFRTVATPAKKPLSDLAIDPDGVVYAVGRAGTIVVSSDGKSFDEVSSGVTEDLLGISSCDGVLWIAGTRGVLLRKGPLR